MEIKMAGGWAKDGAVSEQIEASINDELSRLKARKVPIGASLTHCAECEESISEQRRLAVVGVKLCIACVQERENQHQKRGGINRRGSKDSQLK
ncbi:MAG: RNA polymerase-binding transcription factor DksA [Candidatus Azotimanducaceae bacterium]